MAGPISTKPFQILFASDGSEHAMAAACLINDLPLPPESAITVLGVLIPREASSFAILEKMLEQTRQLIDRDGRNVQVELKTGYPAETIIECSEAHQADLIVLGAKGLRHTLGILLGGVAQQVVEYSSLPVLVVRAPYRSLDKILLVTDGSAHSQRMLAFLGGSREHAPFPLPHGAGLHVAHVVSPVGDYYHYLHASYIGPDIIIPMEGLAAQQAEEENRGKEILSHASEALKGSGIEATTVLLRGDAATEIIQYAKENQIDLIMAGSRGLSLARSWLLGSVSRKLVHYAECSVLVAK